MPVIIKKVVIKNKDGLHARPIMAFVDAANKYKSKVTVIKDKKSCEENEVPQEVDGKSVIQMLSIMASYNTRLSIIVDGEDAEQAFVELVGMIKSNFGED